LGERRAKDELALPQNPVTEAGIGSSRAEKAACKTRQKKRLLTREDIQEERMRGDENREKKVQKRVILHWA